MSALSAFDQLEESDPPVPAVVRVRVGDIRPGVQLRMGKLNRDHVDALALADGAWPPVVISRTDMTIVDGHYRYTAAKQLGHTHVNCIFFDGPKDSVFLEALRRNREHGLPLTFRDREAAASEVLRLHPEWSDRRIGVACCLAPGTVGRIRSVVISPSDHNAQLNTRIGRDGRRRPVDPSKSRTRIVRALKERPEASLREIARIAQVSPATVRAVQEGKGASRRVKPRPDSGDNVAVQKSTRSVGTLPSAWAADAAVVSTTEGEDFAQWFDRTNIGDEWRTALAAIPFSRIYEIADEARRRASAWEEFALLVESRVRAGKAVGAL